LETFYTNYPSLTKCLMTEEEEELLLKHVQLPVDIADVEAVCESAGFQRIQKVFVEDSCLIKAQKPEDDLIPFLANNRSFPLSAPMKG